MSSLRERAASLLGLQTRDQVASQLAAVREEMQSQIRTVRFQERLARAQALGDAEASGVEMNFGKFEYEQLAKLRSGSTKWSELRKMSNDPHVQQALRAASLPLQKAVWEIEPASDSERDVEVAEFVAANLLRQPSERYGSEYFCRSPWRAQRLPEILDMLESGFALFKKTSKRVGTKWVYDRLQFLEPSSVDPSGWKLTGTDEIELIRRTFQTPTNRFHYLKPLEPAEVLLYVWDLKGARFEGRMFTRSMYGAWVRKEFKHKMSAIWVQKRAAPAAYGWFPDTIWGKYQDQCIDFVKAMRGTAAAEAFMAGPLGNDGLAPQLGYAGTDASLDDGMPKLVDVEKAEIAAAGGTKSMLLGETESGSRALGATQGALEMLLVEAIAEIVAEWETHGIANLRGPIEELVDWNFANVDRYPRLVCQKFNPFEADRTFENTIKAWEAGIVPKTPESRRQIVEQYTGINLPDDAYDVEPIIVPPVPPTARPGPNGETRAPETPVQPDEDGGNASLSLESVDDFRKRIAPMLEPMEDAPKGAGFRGRNRLEVQVVNLAIVQETFRVGERDFVTVLRETHRAMIADLMGRLRAGKITTRNLESQRRSKFRGAKRAEARLVAVAMEVGERGFDHVAQEVERQGETTEEAA